MYASLIAAIMAAYYLGDRDHNWIGRVATSVLIIVFLVPNIRLFRMGWISRVDTPVFFRDKVYKRYLNRNDIVLILSFSGKRQMLWQAETGMYFSMAGGYLGPDPPEFTAWPVARDFRIERVGPDFAEQLKGFLGAHRVKAILLDTRAPTVWRQSLSVLRVAPVETGGMLFYKVPSDVLVTYKDVSPVAFEPKYAWRLFLAGLSGAQRYLAAGLSLSKLTPWEAERQGALEMAVPAKRPPWDPRCQGDLWLGTYTGDDIGVGVTGSYAAVKPLIDRFSRYTDQVYFPFPQKISKDPGTETRGQLLMVFTPAQLNNAATSKDLH